MIAPGQVDLPRAMEALQQSVDEACGTIDRLRSDRAKLIEALRTANVAIKATIAQFRDEKNREDASILPDTIDALLREMEAP